MHRHLQATAFLAQRQARYLITVRQSSRPLMHPVLVMRNIAKMKASSKVLVQEYGLSLLTHCYVHIRLPLAQTVHGRDFLVMHAFYAIPFCTSSAVRAMLRPHYQQDEPALNGG